MGLYRIRANFFRLGDNEAHFHWQVSWRWVVCICIDLNLWLGSLEVRVVCGAFCLGGGSWVRGLYY